MSVPYELGIWLIGPELNRVLMGGPERGGAGRDGLG